MNVYELVFVLLCVDLITSAAPWKTPSYRLLFFFKFFEDISPFCGVTDPWFGLLVMSPLGCKARVGNLLHVWRRGIYVIHSLILTTGGTSWQLRWQLSWSLPHTWEQALVGLKTWTYHAINQYSTDWAILTRLIVLQIYKNTNFANNVYYINTFKFGNFLTFFLLHRMQRGN